LPELPDRPVVKLLELVGRLGSHLDSVLDKVPDVPLKFTMQVSDCIIEMLLLRLMKRPRAHSTCSSGEKAGAAPFLTTGAARGQRMQVIVAQPQRRRRGRTPPPPVQWAGVAALSPTPRSPAKAFCTAQAALGLAPAGGTRPRARQGPCRPSC